MISKGIDRVQHTVIPWIYHTNAGLEEQVPGLRPRLKLEALLVAGRGLGGSAVSGRAPGATGARWGKMDLGTHWFGNVAVGL